MPPIPGLTYVTVTGAWLASSTGDPADGTVAFVPSARWLDEATDEVVVPEPVVATLDTDGFISVSLPATDDPGFLPAERSWRVTEQINSYVRQYHIVLQASVPVVSLNSIAPLDPTDPRHLYTLLPDVGDFDGRIDALEVHEVDHETRIDALEGGGGFIENLYVQNTNPGLTVPGLWIQTGLAPAGAGMTFWVEDGV